MKTVEDQTWNVFNVQSTKKSFVQERTHKIYYCPELGISNEKCGGQNLGTFSNFKSMKKV